jgi:hypothetical protein
MPLRASEPELQTPRGTSFGFKVHSSLSLEYLRAGEGEPLEVVVDPDAGSEPHGVLLAEWSPTPELSFHARLYADGDRYRLWTQDGGWISIDPKARRIALDDAALAARREERVWSIPAILCFLERGDLPLHAAAVEIDGAAVLLGAPRTFGKTTLAAGFVRAGHRLLAEDVSCIRPGDRPALIPGPAMLRMRRDVAAAIELPRTYTVREDDDRVHLALAEDWRGDCSPVPIDAVVFLRPSNGELKLERVSPAEAIRDLWSLSFRLPSDSARAESFARIVDFLKDVRVWNLYRPLRFDQIGAAVDRIVGDA